MDDVREDKRFTVGTESEPAKVEAFVDGAFGKQLPRGDIPQPNLDRSIARRSKKFAIGGHCDTTRSAWRGPAMDHSAHLHVDLDDLLCYCDVDSPTVWSKDNSLREPANGDFLDRLQRGFAHFKEHYAVRPVIADDGATAVA